MRRGAGGTRKLPAERVVRPRRSPNAEHPSPLTLRNQCAPQRLSFLFGKKGTYLAGPSIIQRPSLSVQSPVRSSDNLFDPASVLLNGRVSQLAQNPDPSSRPNCSSDLSWVSGPARQRTQCLVPQSPDWSIFSRPSHSFQPVCRHCGRCFGVPQCHRSPLGLASLSNRLPYSPRFIREVAAPYICLLARRAGTRFSERARHTPPRVPPADRGQHLWREQRLRRDSAVSVSRLGLGLDEPRAAQLVPAGLPSHGEPGERGGLLQARERQGTCSGLLCPLLHPGSVPVSSVFVCGALAASRVERKQRIKQLSRQFPGWVSGYTPGLRSSLPAPCQAALKPRNWTALEKKQQKLAFSSLSLPHFAAWEKKKKKNFNDIYKHINSESDIVVSRE